MSYIKFYTFNTMAVLVLAALMWLPDEKYYKLGDKIDRISERYFPFPH